jgi:hypothetical protein
VFRHRHEIESGRTSSISQQIMGLDSAGNLVQASNGLRDMDWSEIVAASSKASNPHTPAAARMRGGPLQWSQPILSAKNGSAIRALSAKKRAPGVVTAILRAAAAAGVHFHRPGRARAVHQDDRLRDDGCARARESESRSSTAAARKSRAAPHVGN